jgi:hypothetical protein
VVSTPDVVLSAVRIASATFLLALAFALPLSGPAVAYWWTFFGRPSQSEMRARRLAYASVGAPPLYVFIGVVRGYFVHFLGGQVSDVTIWIALWIAAALYVWTSGDQRVLERETQSTPALRVAHGVAAALATCYVLFHLTNHLFGLAGPEIHAGVMKTGRTVYRSPFIEPVLVLLLLFQAWSGVRLAWHWSSLRTDVYRIFQIGSGAYVATYLLAGCGAQRLSHRNQLGLGGGCSGWIDSRRLEYSSIAALRARRLLHPVASRVRIASRDARPQCQCCNRQSNLVGWADGRCPDFRDDHLCAVWLPDLARSMNGLKWSQ